MKASELAQSVIDHISASDAEGKVMISAAGAAMVTFCKAAGWELRDAQNMLTDYWASVNFKVGDEQ